jgi:hypothetical protein
MSKRYRILVFGKTDCDKCKVLLRRLDTLLEDSRWLEFERLYRDVETAEGMVDFCKAGCLNPQRIPALVIQRQDPASGRYAHVPADDAPDSAAAKSRLFPCLGLQTDYSDTGRGVISPGMITDVLEAAVTVDA